jgi:membrane protein DedA with SNARE-associated domain
MTGWLSVICRRPALSNLLESITSLVERIISTFGAPGISFIALLENLFPPTPSEVLYPLAGKMAYAGKVSVPAIILAGTLGSLIGSLIYYTLGHRLGENGAREVITRYGTLKILRFRIQLVSVKDLERGLELFERYGSAIVLVARLMPFVHGVVSIPAGVIRMNIVLFMLFTAVGAALWIAPLTIFGYWLGDNWQDVLAWVDTYQNTILVLLAVILAAYIIRRGRQESVH